MCKFGKGIPEEQFCESILNLDLWYKRRCCLKDFLSGALAALVFSGAELFMQFFVKDIMRNKSVKLFYIWGSGSGVVV